ncbi:MAG: DUF4157 domain-containing protein [Pseudomonadota bacterium]
MGAEKVKAKAPPRVVRTPPAIAVSHAPVILPALRVGAVNDPAEREAEVMASRVVASSSPDLAPPVSTAANNAAAPLRRSTEGQPNLDSLTEPPVPEGQQDITVEPAEDVATTELDGDDTSELDGGTPIDTSGDPVPPEEGGEDDGAPAQPLRRAETQAVVGRSGGAAPRDVAAMVAHPGPGRPLPRATRQRIEPFFGTCFKDVRLHDGPADRRAAARIGARAFTHKAHIWLGEGESATNTRLMAHELTHVVQQTSGAETLPINRDAVLSRFPGEGWIEDRARHIPGYTLMTVLLGRTLVSGERVSMTAENLLGGFLGLLPGGTLLFDRLKETRVLQDTFSWVRGRLSDLNLTGSRIRNVLDRIPGDLSVTSPFESLKRIFGPLVRDLVTFVGEIKDKILEFIIRGALKLAGPYADKVWGVIQQARDTLDLILSDPLGFAKNLIKAVVGGFRLFATNILTHLKNGLLGWLFGALDGAGITLPDKLDFKGLMSLVMQILGLTYAKFRKILVKRLGPKGEKLVSMIESSVEIVKVILREGFAGIWQKMLELIENFKETLIGGISTMVITTVVRAGLSWLAGLANPIGAIVKIALAIYDMIVAFLERLEQIAAVAQSIFSSVGAIARGAVENAARFIEQTIGRSVPVVISFLAAALGLGGIPGKIMGVIRKLQRAVERALDKLVRFIVKKAKKLFSRLVKAVNGKRKLPSRNFEDDGVTHRIFGEIKGNSADVMFASRKSTGQQVDQAQKKTMDYIKKREGPAVDAALKIAQQINKRTAAVHKAAQKLASAIKPKSKKKPQLKAIKELDKALLKAAKDMQRLVGTNAKSPVLSTDKSVAFFRYVEPRLADVEGEWGDHNALKKKTSGNVPDTPGYKISSFYEADHTIEKRFPKAVLENLHLLDSKHPDHDPNAEVVKPKDRESRGPDFEKWQKNFQKKNRREIGTETAVANKGVRPLGELGKGDYRSIGKTAGRFPAIIVYRHNHIDDKGLADHLKIIDDARKENSPYTAVKKALRQQLDLEKKEILAQYKKDVTVPKNIMAKVETNLTKVVERNMELYRLGNVKADTSLGGSTKTPKHVTSVLSFEGGSGVPNFLTKEGKGGNFSTLTGMTEHLERDHIVDDAYVTSAQPLELLKKSEQLLLDQEFDSYLRKNNKRTSPKRRANLSRIKTALLFDPTSGIGKYKTNDGYAIPFYKPVARKITSTTGASTAKTDIPAAITGAPAIALEELAKDAVEHTNDGLNSERKKRQKPITKIIETRSDKHIEAAAEAYKKELEHVPSLHPAFSRKLARANMIKIVNRVSKSLSTARARTEKLF